MSENEFQDDWGIEDLVQSTQKHDVAPSPGTNEDSPTLNAMLKELTDDYIPRIETEMKMPELSDTEHEFSDVSPSLRSMVAMPPVASAAVTDDMPNPVPVSPITFHAPPQEGDILELSDEFMFDSILNHSSQQSFKDHSMEYHAPSSPPVMSSSPPVMSSSASSSDMPHTYPLEDNSFAVSHLQFAHEMAAHGDSDGHESVSSGIADTNTAPTTTDSNTGDDVTDAATSALLGAEHVEVVVVANISTTSTGDARAYTGSSAAENDDVDTCAPTSPAGGVVGAGEDASGVDGLTSTLGADELGVTGGAGCGGGALRDGDDGDAAMDADECGGCGAGPGHEDSAAAADVSVDYHGVEADALGPDNCLTNADGSNKFTGDIYDVGVNTSLSAGDDAIDTALSSGGVAAQAETEAGTAAVEAEARVGAGEGGEAEPEQQGEPEQDVDVEGDAVIALVNIDDDNVDKPADNAGKPVNNFESMDDNGNKFVENFDDPDANNDDWAWGGDDFLSHTAAHTTHTDTDPNVHDQTITNPPLLTSAHTPLDTASTDTQPVDLVMAFTDTQRTMRPIGTEGRIDNVYDECDVEPANPSPAIEHAAECAVQLMGVGSPDSAADAIDAVAALRGGRVEPVGVAEATNDEAGVIVVDAVANIGTGADRGIGNEEEEWGGWAEDFDQDSPDPEFVNLNSQISELPTQNSQIPDSSCSAQSPPGAITASLPPPLPLSSAAPAPTPAPTATPLPPVSSAPPAGSCLPEDAPTPVYPKHCRNREKSGKTQISGRKSRSERASVGKVSFDPNPADIIGCSTSIVDYAEYKEAPPSPAALATRAERRQRKRERRQRIAQLVHQKEKDTQIDSETPMNTHERAVDDGSGDSQDPLYSESPLYSELRHRYPAAFPALAHALSQTPSNSLNTLDSALLSPHVSPALSAAAASLAKHASLRSATMARATVSLCSEYGDLSSDTDDDFQPTGAFSLMRRPHTHSDTESDSDSGPEKTIEVLVFRKSAPAAPRRAPPPLSSPLAFALAPPPPDAEAEAGGPDVGTGTSTSTAAGLLGLSPPPPSPSHADAAAFATTDGTTTITAASGGAGDDDEDWGFSDTDGADKDGSTATAAENEDVDVRVDTDLNSNGDAGASNDVSAGVNDAVSGVDSGVDDGEWAFDVEFAGQEEVFTTADTGNHVSEAPDSKNAVQSNKDTVQDTAPADAWGADSGDGGDWANGEDDWDNEWSTASGEDDMPETSTSTTVEASSTMGDATGMATGGGMSVAEAATLADAAAAGALLCAAAGMGTEARAGQTLHQQQQCMRTWRAAYGDVSALHQLKNARGTQTADAQTPNTRVADTHVANTQAGQAGVVSTQTPNAVGVREQAAEEGLRTENAEEEEVEGARVCVSIAVCSEVHKHVGDAAVPVSLGDSAEDGGVGEGSAAVGITAVDTSMPTHVHVRLSVAVVQSKTHDRAADASDTNTAPPTPAAAPAQSPTNAHASHTTPTSPPSTSEAPCAPASASSDTHAPASSLSAAEAAWVSAFAHECALWCDVAGVGAVDGARSRDNTSITGEGVRTDDEVHTSCPNKADAEVAKGARDGVRGVHLSHAVLQLGGTTMGTNGSAVTGRSTGKDTGINAVLTTGNRSGNSGLSAVAGGGALRPHWWPRGPIFHTYTHTHATNTNANTSTTPTIAPPTPEGAAVETEATPGKAITEEADAEAQLWSNYESSYQRCARALTACVGTDMTTTFTNHSSDVDKLSQHVDSRLFVAELVTVCSANTHTTTLCLPPLPHTYTPTPVAITSTVTFAPPHATATASIDTEAASSAVAGAGASGASTVGSIGMSDVSMGPTVAELDAFCAHLHTINTNAAASAGAIPSPNPMSIGAHNTAPSSSSRSRPRSSASSPLPSPSAPLSLSSLYSFATPPTHTRAHAGAPTYGNTLYTHAHAHAHAYANATTNSMSTNATAPYTHAVAHAVAQEADEAVSMASFLSDDDDEDGGGSGGGNGSGITDGIGNDDGDDAFVADFNDMDDAVAMDDTYSMGGMGGVVNTGNGVGGIEGDFASTDAHTHAYSTHTSIPGCEPEEADFFVSEHQWPESTENSGQTQISGDSELSGNVDFPEEFPWEDEDVDFVSADAFASAAEAVGGVGEDAANVKGDLHAGARAGASGGSGKEEEGGLDGAGSVDDGVGGGDEWGGMDFTSPASTTTSTTTSTTSTATDSFIDVVVAGDVAAVGDVALATTASDDLGGFADFDANVEDGDYGGVDIFTSAATAALAADTETGAEVPTDTNTLSNISTHTSNDATADTFSDLHFADLFLASEADRAQSKEQEWSRAVMAGSARRAVGHALVMQAMKKVKDDLHWLRY